jgi:hypothetical protein
LAEIVGVRPLGQQTQRQPVDPDNLFARNDVGSKTAIDVPRVGRDDPTQNEEDTEVRSDGNGAIPSEREKDRGKFPLGLQPPDPTIPLRSKPWEENERGQFIREVKRRIQNPPKGTSNDSIVNELPKAYPEKFNEVRRLGPGKTIFGSDKMDIFRSNSFTLTPTPEESVDDRDSLTYHKYGVLTYIGPVDAAKGITKEALIKLMIERYSRPGYLLHPSPPDFEGLTEAYATSPFNAFRNGRRNLNDPWFYNERIGSIAQVRVLDGVVNITETDHGVYPGTIRRTVLEVDGHLYVVTQGSGSNRFQNQAVVDAQGVTAPGQMGFRTARRAMAAFGNDSFGPLAFRALDHELYKDVERVRNGQPLPPVDTRRNVQESMPPALMYQTGKKRPEQ